MLLPPHVPTNISVVIGLCSLEWNTLLLYRQSIYPTADTGVAKLGVTFYFVRLKNNKNREIGVKSDEILFQFRMG